ncbi:MAG: RluA family pseudouridine synthase [Candidatus Peregrinibacteria bacterium]
MNFRAAENLAGIRLDKAVVMKNNGLSRSKIQNMIKAGRITVNGKSSKANYILANGDAVSMKEVPATKAVLKKEKFDLPIMIEKKDYFVIDKPAGIVVHPGENGEWKGTLANRLLGKVKAGAGADSRPGIVHRLDKNTSGLLIIAKTAKGYNYFVEQFKKRAVQKVYLALVKGVLKHKEGIIDSPIGRDPRNRKRMAIVTGRRAKEAVTHFKVLDEFQVDKKSFVSLVEVEIKTGRTHQIRVHMAAIGHAVIGDDTYGVGSFNRRFREVYGLKRQFLHAGFLKFKDPATKKYVEVKSHLPEDLDAVIKELEGL